MEDGGVQKQFSSIHIEGCTGPAYSRAYTLLEIYLNSQSSSRYLVGKSTPGTATGSNGIKSTKLPVYIEFVTFEKTKSVQGFEGSQRNTPGPSNRGTVSIATISIKLTLRIVTNGWVGQWGTKGKKKLQPVPKLPSFG